MNIIINEEKKSKTTKKKQMTKEEESETKLPRDVGKKLDLYIKQREIGAIIEYEEKKIVTIVIHHHCEQN